VATLHPESEKQNDPQESNKPTRDQQKSTLHQPNSTKQAPKLTENVIDICGHGQLNDHRPELTEVLLVQSGVVPSQQAAMTIGQVQDQAGNQTKQWVGCRLLS